MKLKPEEIEQVILFDWIRTQPPIDRVTFHIANERNLNVKVNPGAWQTGKKLQRMGVKSGVADIFIAQARGGYHGMWIELKAGKNKASSTQKEFLAIMTEEGYLAACVTGWEAAKHFILEYFKMPIFS